MQSAAPFFLAFLPFPCVLLSRGWSEKFFALFHARELPFRPLLSRSSTFRQKKYKRGPFFPFFFDLPLSRGPLSLSGIVSQPSFSDFFFLVSACFRISSSLFLLLSCCDLSSIVGPSLGYSELQYLYGRKGRSLSFAVYSSFSPKKDPCVNGAVAALFSPSLFCCLFHVYSLPLLPRSTPPSLTPARPLFFPHGAFPAVIFGGHSFLSPLPPFGQF